MKMMSAEMNFPKKRRVVRAKVGFDPFHVGDHKAHEHFTGGCLAAGGFKPGKVEPRDDNQQQAIGCKDRTDEGVG